MKLGLWPQMHKPLSRLIGSGLWIAALIAMLTPGAALAEPIIIIISQHNLEYAKRACSNSWLNAEGIAECKLFGDVGDVRDLGRKFENEVRSQKWRLIHAVRAWMYSG